MKRWLVVQLGLALVGAGRLLLAYAYLSVYQGVDSATDGTVWGDPRLVAFLTWVFIVAATFAAVLGNRVFRGEPGAFRWFLLAAGFAIVAAVRAGLLAASYVA